MKKFIIAALTAAAALGATVPSQAAGEEQSDTKSYDSSAVVVSLTGGAVNVGGVSFAAPGFAPTKIVLRDETKLNGSLIVGQDFNNNRITGEAGEPSAIGCGTVVLSTSKVAFDPTKPISVFVQTAAAACPGQVATTGAVDLYIWRP